MRKNGTGLLLVDAIARGWAIWGGNALLCVLCVVWRFGEEMPIYPIQ